MYPLRGALIRVRNDGKAASNRSPAHCVSHDELGDKQDIIFIVPRGSNMLLLGGLAEPDEWSLDIGLDNYRPIQEMYNRCIEFMPVLKNAEIDVAEPVRVGACAHSVGRTSDWSCRNPGHAHHPQLRSWWSGRHVVLGLH